MAVIEVTISNHGGARVPSVERIALESGVSVEFKADENAPTLLCLSDQLAAILSPRPESHDIRLAAGEALTLSIPSAKPGRYCIILQSPDFPRPNNIRCGKADAAVLLLITGDGSEFPVGPTDPQQIDDSGTPTP